jgi:hypothetical protein
MKERLRKSLPFVAAIAALTALLMSTLAGPWLGRRALLADTGETRRVVESSALARFQELHPKSIDDAPLREAIDQARDVPYVAVVWLFAPDGQIIEGNRALSRGTVDESATDEMHRVLGMLPEEALSAAQRTALLAASTMQKEGEHNDIYRHLLREVRGPDGGLVALIGVTFEVSPAVSAPGAWYISLIITLLVAVSVYWLSLPAWVWLDARARGERVWAWAVFVLIGNLVALMAYLLTRSPRLHASSIE